MATTNSKPGRKPVRLTAEKIRLAQEISTQLKDCGGAAHREVVIGRILTRRGVSGPAADRTRRALLSAFDLHLHPPAEIEAPCLFDLPFGPDSYRWALQPEPMPV